MDVSPYSGGEVDSPSPMLDRQRSTSSVTSSGEGGEFQRRPRTTSSDASKPSPLHRSMSMGWNVDENGRGTAKERRRQRNVELAQRPPHVGNVKLAQVRDDDWREGAALNPHPVRLSPRLLRLDVTAPPPPPPPPRPSTGEETDGLP